MEPTDCQGSSETLPPQRLFEILRYLESRVDFIATAEQEPGDTIPFEDLKVKVTVGGDRMKFFVEWDSYFCRVYIKPLHALFVAKNILEIQRLVGPTVEVDERVITVGPSIIGTYGRTVICEKVEHDRETKPLEIIGCYSRFLGILTAEYRRKYNEDLPNYIARSGTFLLVEDKLILHDPIEDNHSTLEQHILRANQSMTAVSAPSANPLHPQVFLPKHLLSL